MIHEYISQSLHPSFIARHHGYFLFYVAELSSLALGWFVLSLLHNDQTYSHLLWHFVGSVAAPVSFHAVYYMRRKCFYLLLSAVRHCLAAELLVYLCLKHSPYNL